MGFLERVLGVFDGRPVEVGFFVVGNLRVECLVECRRVRLPVEGRLVVPRPVPGWLVPCCLDVGRRGALLDVRCRLESIVSCLVDGRLVNDLVDRCFAVACLVDVECTIALRLVDVLRLVVRRRRPVVVYFVVARSLVGLLVPGRPVVECLVGRAVADRLKVGRLDV